ncbi:dynein intermediate chain 3, ciliary-like [Photinus pyralis]|uniref:dynein intermediate chain 3, ciliary-like n=1 Tax=Photinus pyralis TaxID=7054 RepID=UPI001266F9DC|nr:dynein intermediate chain 3, ciliary-like [Photinus pyralis]
MEVQYVYQKKRTEFGRQCVFSDKGPDLIDNYPSNWVLLENYILKDPFSQGTQCNSILAEHDANTTRATFVHSGMNHTEGGWPKDINKEDEEQTKRYRRKIEKEDSYNPILMHLCKNMEDSVLQNNSINIYQQYFSDVEPTPLVEKSSARIVNVYQDQCPTKRVVNRISWSPDGGTKLAVTHCDLKFQQPFDIPTSHSYIWDIENPNRPLLIFQPKFTPMVCLEYHTKDVNTLVSGQLSGRLAVWDSRKGCGPVNRSLTEVSHREPVMSVLWINSKSGLEFFSTSTDGQVKWWDARKLTEPLETLILSSPGQIIQKAMSASCLEYETTIPTRFMVGTEKGVIISCNRKGKSPSEKMALRFSAHLGPVLAIQRNAAYVKNFLSVGDWTVRIWSEDCKESSIMWTCYHRDRLTDGAWSPTRVSVFFTTRSDGSLDVWDILQQQERACISMKVSDEPLSCLRVHEQGRLVAVGNVRGTTNLVQLSENLSYSTKLDRTLLTAMFERESRRERILEARNREIKLKLKTKSGLAVGADSVAVMEVTETVEKTVASDPEVYASEEEFFSIISAAEAKDTLK